MKTEKRIKRVRASIKKQTARVKKAWYCKISNGLLQDVKLSKAVLIMYVNDLKLREKYSRAFRVTLGQEGDDFVKCLHTVMVTYTVPAPRK